MSRISCNTCMDLIPLVKDGIASEDSRQLVLEHIAECEECRSIYESEPSPEELSLSMDEQIVTRKIKKGLLFFITAAILFGISAGMMMTDSMNMFYNALIMPAIGFSGYMFLRRKAYIAPLAVGGFAFIWQIIENLILSGIPSQNVWENIMMCMLGSFMVSCIYVLFCVIGIVIAWAFHYAFSKED